MRKEEGKGRETLTTFQINLSNNVHYYQKMDHERLAKSMNEEQREYTEKLKEAKGKEASVLWKCLRNLREIRSNMDDIWMKENKEKSHTQSPYYRSPSEV